MEVARKRPCGEVLGSSLTRRDDFKRINDVHGQEAGEEVLRQTGDLLRRSPRTSDFVVR
jgi:GGDEF domain-containing protein